ncbi:hypothetical protein DM02DRAFT_666518 [Periconia macrospinosa]|uniref:Protein FAF1 n=1 Tax=Periconia macrospinosa TaxID=97972 RepID=A0A2V1EE05_9PLEO|nr:hypothetical protein DM02DRAFT_666518 [Periconia macrospinosa]
MAPTLGKRKRVTREELERPSRSPSPSSESQESDGSEDVQALFRKAFEAKFKPLDIEPVQKKVKEDEIEHDDEEIEEEDSDWSGISSEDENDDGVEVFDYAANNKQPREKMSKAELRAFMSSKPPPLSSASTTTKPTKTPKLTPADTTDPTEASHLKNDLDLQNLLRESHLLSTYNPTYSTRVADPSAPKKSSSVSTRHKIADMHMQSLGAKGSAFSQKSMPMSQRKGIAAKAKLREELRRKEAKENGIILEREKKGDGAGKKASAKRRDVGVGGPSVGKFKNGTLTLSRKDVASITRDGGGSGGRKGKGKKGRR